MRAREGRRILAVLLIVLVGQLAVARTPEQLEDTIDFDTSLDTVAEAVRRGAIDQIEVERYLMVEGSVASIIVFDPNPDTYQAVVELVSARWQGLESIDVNRVYVLLQGPSFADRVLERPNPNAGPQAIQVNQQLLVIGPFVGTAALEDEELGVIQAVRAR
jgi:hypothetical protein